MWVYLIVYSIGRFVIEQIRIDSATVGGLKTPAIVAILTIVIAWTMLIYRHRPGSNVPYSESNLPEGVARRQPAPAGVGKPAIEADTEAARTSRVRRVQAFTTTGGSAETAAKPDTVAQE